MAPKTSTNRVNPVSTIAIKAGISLLLLVATVILPISVSAAPLAVPTTLSDLLSFTSSIQNGDASVLRGVYVDGLFALPVVQQPGYNAGYVSTADNTMTQFGMATQFGSVGLLAHNYLSGQYFFELIPGMMVQLIYGDGHIEYFQITQIYRYQATAPFSVYSDFVDLATQEYLTGSALFSKVYSGSGHVTFQTCISQDGNSSWGRLFVIAEPVHTLVSVTGSN
jgi:hypothetical protein